MWIPILTMSSLLGGVLFTKLRKVSALVPAYSGPIPGHPSIVLRQLQYADFARGFPDILSQLTDVGHVNNKDLRKRLHQLRSSGVYVVIILHDTVNDSIIGTASLLIEAKFIHSNGKVGHIEDVVVSETHRGKSLGKTLIDALTATAQQNGCYKTILDCAESRVAFYQKCGMSLKGMQMAIYH